MACIYAQAGYLETAMDYLEEAVENGFTQTEWITNDSDLEPVRTTRRDQILVRNLR